MGTGGWKHPETLKRLVVAGVFVVLIAAGLAPQPASGQALGSSAAGGSPSYVSPTSWALGVVAPNNAQLAGGGGMSWGEVNNVTAQIELPEINQTDATVDAVLSVMTTGGNVLQVAAGIPPVKRGWLTYAQFVSNITATSENYQTIANGSLPEMSPGDLVVLSIFVSSGVWSYELSDLNSHSSTQGMFPGGGASLAAGNQEVFALESYSENRSVFAHMGNLTLQSLTFDGRRVVQGLYVYNNLDWENGPLFVVGGFANPPSFISVQRAGDGAVVWSYVEEWTGQPPSLTPPATLTILAAIAVFFIAAVIFVRVRWTRFRPALVSNSR